jgi:hypothetical protein
MSLSVPRTLKIEHDQLHETLRQATRESGELGKAARAVAELMHPHFIKEEQYALPPLSLLPRVAQGVFEPAMAEVLSMTDKLKAELPQMLSEHKAIVKALETLAESARRANRLEYSDFAHKLIHHAQTEEEVSYPAALLVGEFVRSKLGR